MLGILHAECKHAYSYACWIYLGQSLIPGVIALVWIRSNVCPNTQSELQSSTRNLQLGGTLYRQSILVVLATV